MEQILGVADWRSFATTANSAFLLAFSSLFSIINPIGGALIFYGFTKDFSSSDRVKVAARVGFYSLLIMFGALMDRDLSSCPSSASRSTPCASGAGW